MKPLKLLSELRHRFIEAEFQLHETYAMAKAGLHRLDVLADWTRKERRAVPTFVYVLSPTSPMMALSQAVQPDQRIQLYFEPYTTIPVGSWVVVAGPATVRGVRVGNMMQSAMSDYHGHVCQLKDEAHPGVRITVELGA